MLLTEFIHALEEIVPLSAAGYERDALGLQVGVTKNTELNKALFAYEVTPEVIAEARERGANLIVAFHPLIFPSIAAVTDATRTGALIRELVKSDIALYIQHTAFDTHPQFGTSRLMAEALGLENIRTLAPSDKINSLLKKENFGMGALGELPNTLGQEDFIRLVSTTFHSTSVRYNTKSSATIRTVAMVGGSGMDYYNTAIALRADAFITADIRYHDFYRADHDGILLIDAGHAETETFVTQGMVRAARKALNVLNLHTDELGSSLIPARFAPNSVRYYCQP